MTSTLWIATAATAVSSFCFLTTVRAQNENQRTDTEIADNPHLRKSKQSSSSSSSSKLSPKDQKFITNAATSGFQEVADSQVAQQQGGPAVKNVGARMVADHSKANKELIALARKKNLSIDTTPAKPRPFKKEGFDSQYLFNLQHDLEMDIKAFEQEASSGDDADVKGWAKQTLPMLKDHLAMVKSALKKLK